ncbi:MAG: hypothetical protein ABFS34_04150 [Gemmatimonadota bacterium]
MGVVIAVIVIAAVVTFLDGWRRQGNYDRAVRDQAIAAGMAPESLRYQKHWPLDLYMQRLANVADPASVERLAREASGIGYYIVPIAGTDTDSALVQVLEFDVGGRTSSVQVEYRRGRRRTLDGSDGLPPAHAEVARGVAMSWFDGNGAR